MNNWYLFLIIILLIIAVIPIIVYQSKSVYRIHMKELLTGFNNISTMENRIVTESDLIKLPNCVKKYLNYVGVVGTERVRSIRIITEIDMMSIGKSKESGKMYSDEYDFFGERPGRTVFMKFKISGINVFGLDSYINGIGRMLMKPLGLVPFVNTKGKKEDNSSALVMLFLSMCTSAPASLIDERIKWTVISSLSAKATYDDCGQKVSAVLDFNSKGELVNFSTEDKYFSPTGKKYEKVKWSTPILNYKLINGLMLPTYGEAIWHFPQGDFCYGKNTLKEIQYNIKKY